MIAQSGLDEGATQHPTGCCVIYSTVVVFRVQGSAQQRRDGNWDLQTDERYGKKSSSCQSVWVQAKIGLICPIRIKPMTDPPGFIPPHGNYEELLSHESQGLLQFRFPDRDSAHIKSFVAICLNGRG